MTLLSVGLELEVETVRRLNLPPALQMMFRATHDASTEAMAPTIDGQHIMYGSSSTRSETFGFEYVSRIINVEDESLIRQLLMTIKAAGEPRHSTRGSIHIHIGVGHNLQMLKNIMKLWLFSEKFWYHLGGMGYKYRGWVNESVYCRPMRASQAVPHGDIWVRAIDVDSCLKATRLSEFWSAYGIPQDYREKYHPSRYQGLNVYSLLLHETLEFRIFNKCLKPDWVMEVVNICKAFTAAVMNPNSRFNLPENDLFSQTKAQYIWDILCPILQETGIEFNPDIIREILLETEEPDIPNPDIKTHLRRFEGHPIFRGHPRVSSPDESGFLDIHSDGAARYNLFKECN